MSDIIINERQLNLIREIQSSSNNITTQSTTTTNDNPLEDLFSGIFNGQLGKEALEIS
jgi:hypothetical protein